jgi:hypothetical protein
MRKERVVAMLGMLAISALGQKWTCRRQILMSALPLKAGINRGDRDVCFVPIADIALIQ